MSRSKKDMAIVPFHLIVRQALVSGVATLTLNPSTLSGRLLIEADAWAHFRVLKLKFRLHPATTPTSDQAVGFVGGIQDTPPSTIVQVMELLPSTLLGIRATNPTRWVAVSRSDLAGPFPWYKAINGTADVTEESPGQIIVSGTGTDAISLEIYVTLEFKTAVSSGNTPSALGAMLALREERAALARERERSALVEVLGGEPSLKPAPKPRRVIPMLPGLAPGPPAYPGLVNAVNAPDLPNSALQYATATNRGAAV